MKILFSICANILRIYCSVTSAVCWPVWTSKQVHGYD